MFSDLARGVGYWNGHLQDWTGQDHNDEQVTAPVLPILPHDDPSHRHGITVSPRLPSAGHTRSLPPGDDGKVAMSKTYITRKGALVLFTAPEDPSLSVPESKQKVYIHKARKLLKHRYGDQINKLGKLSRLAESILMYGDETELPEDASISDPENKMILKFLHDLDKNKGDSRSRPGSELSTYLRNLRSRSNSARSRISSAYTDGRRTRMSRPASSPHPRPVSAQTPGDAPLLSVERDAGRFVRSVSPASVYTQDELHPTSGKTYRVLSANKLTASLRSTSYLGRSPTPGSLLAPPGEPDAPPGSRRSSVSSLATSRSPGTTLMYTGGQDVFSVEPSGEVPEEDREPTPADSLEMDLVPEMVIGKGDESEEPDVHNRPPTPKQGPPKTPEQGPPDQHPPSPDQGPLEVIGVDIRRVSKPNFDTAAWLESVDEVSPEEQVQKYLEDAHQEMKNRDESLEMDDFDDFEEEMIFLEETQTEREDDGEKEEKMEEEEVAIVTGIQPLMPVYTGVVASQSPEESAPMMHQETVTMGTPPEGHVTSGEDVSGSQLQMALESLETAANDIDDPPRGVTSVKVTSRCGSAASSTRSRTPPGGRSPKPNREEEGSLEANDLPAAPPSTRSTSPNQEPEHASSAANQEEDNIGQEEISSSIMTNQKGENKEVDESAETNQEPDYNDKDEIATSDIKADIEETRTQDEEPKKSDTQSTVKDEDIKESAPKVGDDGKNDVIQKEKDVTEPDEKDALQTDLKEDASNIKPSEIESLKSQDEVNAKQEKNILDVGKEAEATKIKSDQPTSPEADKNEAEAESVSAAATVLETPSKSPVTKDEGVLAPQKKETPTGDGASKTDKKDTGKTKSSKKDAPKGKVKSKSKTKSDSKVKEPKVTSESREAEESKTTEVSQDIKDPVSPDEAKALDDQETTKDDDVKDDSKASDTVINDKTSEKPEVKADAKISDGKAEEKQAKAESKNDEALKVEEDSKTKVNKEPTKSKVTFDPEVKVKPKPKVKSEPKVKLHSKPAKESKTLLDVTQMKTPEIKVPEKTEPIIKTPVDSSPPKTVTLFEPSPPKSKPSSKKSSGRAPSRPPGTPSSHLYQPQPPPQRSQEEVALESLEKDVSQLVSEGRTEDTELTAEELEIERQLLKERLEAAENKLKGETPPPKRKSPVKKGQGQKKGKKGRDLQAAQEREEEEKAEQREAMRAAKQAEKQRRLEEAQQLESQIRQKEEVRAQEMEDADKRQQALQEEIELFRSEAAAAQKMEDEAREAMEEQRQQARVEREARRREELERRKQDAKHRRKHEKEMAEAARRKERQMLESIEDAGQRSMVAAEERRKHEEQERLEQEQEEEDEREIERDAEDEEENLRELERQAEEEALAFLVKEREDAERRQWALLEESRQEEAEKERKRNPESRLAIIEDQRRLEAELAAKEAEEQRLQDEERRRYDELRRMEEEAMDRMRQELEARRQVALRRRELNLDRRRNMTKLSHGQGVTRPWTFTYYIDWPRETYMKRMGQDPKKKGFRPAKKKPKPAT